MQQVIRKQEQQSQYKFELFWVGVDNSKIFLDFEPILNTYQLLNKSNFALLHWQAKPKGLRRWGVFYKGVIDGVETTRYFGVDHDKLKFINPKSVVPLQIDEKVHITLPTAVMYFDNVKLQHNSNDATITLTANT